MFKKIENAISTSPSAASRLSCSTSDTWQDRITNWETEAGNTLDCSGHMSSGFHNLICLWRGCRRLSTNKLQRLWFLCNTLRRRWSKYLLCTSHSNSNTRSSSGLLVKCKEITSTLQRGTTSNLCTAGYCIHSNRPTHVLCVIWSGASTSFFHRRGLGWITYA